MSDHLTERLNRILPKLISDELLSGQCGQANTRPQTLKLRA